MKRTVIAIVLAIIATSANAEKTTEEQNLACGAVMCLTMDQKDRPHECWPFVKAYFDQRGRKPWETDRARAEFLRKCPQKAVDHAINYDGNSSSGGGQLK